MPASLARIVSAAILAAACAAACQGVIAGHGTPLSTSSGTGAVSSSGAGAAASGGTSSATTSASSSTTSTSASSSSATTSASTSVSSSGGGSCAPACNLDADCQDTCPSPAAGTTYCCDDSVNLCYLSPTDICVPACVDGGECPPGMTCTPSAACPLLCTCDATGHYACTPSQIPQCPSPHATCGDPCAPYQGLACMCASSPGSASLLPCDCNPMTNLWTCGASGGCPPDAIVSGSTCADYPVGLLCSAGFGQCACTPCGPPAWYCY